MKHKDIDVNEKKQSEEKIFDILFKEPRISFFENSNFLQEIVIPSTVTIIEPNAFKNCTQLTKVKILSSVIQISKDSFNKFNLVAEFKFSQNNFSILAKKKNLI